MSPPPPKALRLYGHINNTQHIYVDDVGCKYQRAPTAESGDVHENIDVVKLNGPQGERYWGMDHAFYYQVKDHGLKDVTLVHGDAQTSLAHDIKHSESKSKRVFKPLDATIIHPIPSLDGDKKCFKTRLGITFEMFYLGPPNLVNERPLLRMLEEHVSKTIVYQDVCENLYKPIPHAHLCDIEAKGWFPCLSRIYPKTGNSLQRS